MPMPETPESASAFEPECWCDSDPCECPGSPGETPEAVIPQPVQDGYDAVYAYIGELGDRMPADPVHRNAVIWRAVRAFRAATLPAHGAMVRRAYHAELFGTPEEIRQREIEAKANAKPDDPIELCERIRPGLHERRVRAKVATAFEAVAIEMESGGWTIAADHMRHAAALARGEQP